LAAAEACWEGLLGLPPVKRMRISRFSRRARWGRILRYLAVAYPWWSWWWQTLSIVGVVFVGTVAGEVVVASRRVEKFARGRRNSLQSHNQPAEIARTWRSASGSPRGFKPALEHMLDMPQHVYQTQSKNVFFTSLYTMWWLIGHTFLLQHSNIASWAISGSRMNAYFFTYNANKIPHLMLRDLRTINSLY
jgi:hypothetical protein